MATKRPHKGLPKLFVGSAVENLDVAHAIQEALQNDAEVTVWTEDVFTLSDSALSGFQRVLEGADCALFISDIATGKRASSSINPNLTLELGMSIGFLGAERTACLLTARSAPDLPSYLRGISVFRFSGSIPDKLRAAIVPIANSVRRWMRKSGRRKSRSKQRAHPSELIPRVLKKTKRPVKPRAVESQSRSARNSVFISYSHADSKWLARISTMLTPLVRSDRISVWDDTVIKPGAKWGPEIKRAIASARVALLLVSPSFLASRFILDDELPPILNAAEEKGLVIVWALVSACLYKKTAIAEYQAAHPIAKPLDSLPPPKRNQALLAIAETIGAALESGRPKA